ncbi:MAG: glycosyltransferase family 1 protein [bacterium]|nr:glycosyltransferase family 1 protein [bacterium]
MKIAHAEVTEKKKIRVALMSYAMDGRQAKGSALSTHRLVERLVRNLDLEVTLVHFDKSDDPLYKEAREIIMPQFKLPVATRFFRTLAFFWKYRHEQFDIIHWFQSRVYPFFWLAPARKIIITAHAGGDITSPGKFPLSRRMFNFVLTHFSHKVDAIVGVSNFGRDEIIEAYGADPKRVYSLIHYNGGAEEFQPLDKHTARKHMREKHGIDGHYILDVSRLMPHKNVTTLVHAYIQLREKYPEHRELLVVAGSANYKANETYELARSSKYSDDIRFIDFVEQEDMNALYSGAEIFVFPSLSEGFGMPLIEAFASGTPVITSDLASMPEVSAGATILVDPKDISAIAAAMHKLLTDEALRKDLVTRGLERCRVFTWDLAAKEVSDLYKHVMNMK